MEKGYKGADKALEYLFKHATEVSAAQILTTGTWIATITIDGEDLMLYAPEALTRQQVQTMIDNKVDPPGLSVVNGKVCQTYEVEE